MNRRDFLKSSAAAGSLLVANAAAAAAPAGGGIIEPVPASAGNRPRLPDLAPARWIWYPSGRTLQNTFILFRRELKLAAKPRRATGWICADSRYRLEVNGERVQWGPPPCDPRWPEADPLDLTVLISRQEKTFLARRCSSMASGTAPGRSASPGSCSGWRSSMRTAGWRRSFPTCPGRRCCAGPGRPDITNAGILRALQEEFDARLYPDGWARPGFHPDANWLPAMPLSGSPNKPALWTDYYEYSWTWGAARLTRSFVPAASR